MCLAGSFYDFPWPPPQSHFRWHRSNNDGALCDATSGPTSCKFGNCLAREFQLSRRAIAVPRSQNDLGIAFSSSRLLSRSLCEKCCCRQLVRAARAKVWITKMKSWTFFPSWKWVEVIIGLPAEEYHFFQRITMHSVQISLLPLFVKFVNLFTKVQKLPYNSELYSIFLFCFSWVLIRRYSLSSNFWDWPRCFLSPSFKVSLMASRTRPRTFIESATASAAFFFSWNARRMF